MIDREDVVAAVVDAAGGELASRIRLQKTIYLLDRLGFQSDFDDYAYYHYGPYSASLDASIEDAKAFKLVQEDCRQRQSDGASYSIFRLCSGADVKQEAYRGLDREVTGELVSRFVATNLTVLELAATVDWLWRFEKCEDWWSEVTKRKGVKAKNGRLEKAVALLTELGLPPPALRAAT